MKFRLILTTLPFILLFSACAEFPMIATQNDIVKVEEKVSTLKDSMESIQQNQAELGMRLEELMESLLVVMENVEVLTRKITKGGAKTVSNKTSRTNKKPATGQSSAAKEIYDLAYKDYIKGDYSLAIMGFRELLKRYQNDDLASETQYWIGECYYSQNKLEEAAKGFDKVVSGFPGSDAVKKAKFKKALVLVKLNKTEKAKILFDEIIKKYPRTNEAKQAEERIKELTNQ